MVKISKDRKAHCLILLLSFLIISFLGSCSKKAANQAVVTYKVGNVILQRPGKSDQPLKLREIVKNGDIIRTGPKSYTAIQVGGEILIRVEDKTLVEVEDLLDFQNRSIRLKRGRILSKMESLTKGARYRVETRTAVAAARGTEFSVSYDDKESRVAVRAGRVMVQKRDKSQKVVEEKNLDNGNTAIIVVEEKKKIKIEKSSRLDSLYLEKVAIIPFVKSPENRAEEELKKMGIQVRSKEIELEKKIKIEKYKLTLADIKAKYKRIDEVTLYTGKVYRGVILSRGKKNFKLLTPAGIIKIPSKKVRKTRMIR